MKKRAQLKWICFASSLFCVTGALIYSAPTINWKPCEGAPDFSCGTLSVPMDYKNPTLYPNVSLDVSMHQHNPNADYKGVLILNQSNDNAAYLKYFFPLLSN